MLCRGGAWTVPNGGTGGGSGPQISGVRGGRGKIWLAIFGKQNFVGTPPPFSTTSLASQASSPRPQSDPLGPSPHCGPWAAARAPSTAHPANRAGGRGAPAARSSCHLCSRPPTVDTFYERDSSLTRERVKGNPMIGQHLSRNQRNDTFKVCGACGADVVCAPGLRRSSGRHTDPLPCRPPKPATPTGRQRAVRLHRGADKVAARCGFWAISFSPPLFWCLVNGLVAPVLCSQGAPHQRAIQQKKKRKGAKIIDPAPCAPSGPSHVDLVQTVVVHGGARRFGLHILWAMIWHLRAGRGGGGRCWMFVRTSCSSAAHAGLLFFVSLGGH